MKDKQWHFRSGNSNFIIFAGRAQGEVKRARQIWRAEEPWEQARRKQDSKQTVWEGDKVQIRSCIYLIDILPLILMEILSPRACQWKPNPPPRDTQHCSKQNPDDDKVIFISSAIKHSLAPSSPFLFPSQKPRRREWVEWQVTLVNAQQNPGTTLLLPRRA